MPSANTPVKFLYGLQANYNLIEQKDTNTFYFTTDEQRMFVGDIEYTRPVQHGTQLPSGYSPRNSLFVLETGGVRDLYYSKDGASWEKIAHLPAAVTGGVFGGNTTTSLDFGGTFNIPKVTIDNSGSVTAAEDVELTLPEIPADVARTTGANFTGAVTVQAPTSDMNPATKQYVDNVLGANDAMVFKGTVGAGGTVTDFSALTNYQVGWTYRVIESGTYAGVACEVGDLLIAVADYSDSFDNADWTVAQTNIDGAVTAGATLANGALVLGDGNKGVATLTNGTDGQVLKMQDGSVAWADEVENTDTTYTFANGENGSFTVTPSTGGPQTVSIGKPATAGTADKVANSLTINGTVYDGSAARSVTIPTSYDLDDLTDVTTTTPADSDVLAYNGTGWVNEPASGLSVGSAGSLTTPRTIGLSGAATAAGVEFDGTENITINVTGLNAANLSGAIPRTVTAVTQAASDNSTAIATTAFVAQAVSTGSVKWGTF